MIELPCPRRCDARPPAGEKILNALASRSAVRSEDENRPLVHSICRQVTKEEG